MGRLRSDRYAPRPGLGWPTAVRIALPSALLALVGCVDPDEPERTKGDRITVITYDGIEPCGGQVEFYDLFLNRATHFWAGSASVDGEVAADLHVMSTDRYGDTAECSSDSSGCTARGGTTAWMNRQFPDLHELAHVVTGAGGSSTAALNEGIAEAMGRSFRYQLNAIPSSHPDEYFFDTYAELESYLEPAMYARFLVDQHGVDTFRAFFHSLDASSTRDEIVGSYESLLGVSYELEASQFGTDVRCVFQLPYCEGDLVPTALPIVVELDADECSDPAWLGFSSPHLAPTVVGGNRYFPFQVHVLDLAQDEELTLSLDNAVVSAANCGAACDEQRFVSLTSSAGSPPVQTRLFEAGRYFLHIEPFDSTVGSFRAEIRR